MIVPQPLEGTVATSIVSRPRLIDLIAQPVQAPITLISAPAGFGKTTLAMQWVDQAAGEVAWLSLGPEHDDPGRFLDDLAAALSLPEEEFTFQTIFDQLRNRPGGYSVTIVLDDLHRVSNDAVLRTLTRLLRARIPGVHWFVLTRIVSRLPVARLRAKGLVREIGMDALTFTRSEVAGVTKLLRQRAISRVQAERLMAFTDGWIAAILLTLQGLGPDVVESGDEGAIGARASEWIDAYLAEEVVDDLPPEVRRFLLQTCALPYLTPEFAMYVAGVDEDVGRCIFATLERHQIVRRRMTESGSTLDWAGWIAPGLRRIAEQRLSREERAIVSERIARYLLEQDVFDLALERAWISDDLTLKTEIVRTLHTSLALEDRTYKIRTLIQTLPEPVILQYPDLTYSYAFALQDRGDTSAMASIVSRVLPEWMASADPLLRGYAMNCKGFMLVRSGEVAEALQCFRDALRHFPSTQYRERLHSLAGVISTASMLGDDDLVERAVGEARVCVSFLPHHQVTWWMHIQTRLANHHAFRGDVSLAGEMYDQLLHNLPPTFSRPLPFFDHLMAAPRFEANDLDGAEARIAASLETVAARPHDNWHANGFALGACIAHARGAHELAEERLAKARAAATFFNNRHLLMQVDTIKASWSIEEGNLLAARAWEGYWHPNGYRWSESFGHLNPMATLLQFRIAEQRFEEAIALADEALAEGAKLKRRLEMITILMWSAIARERAGDHDGAMSMLRRALELRTDNAIVRAFVTPGYDLACWQRADIPPMLQDHLDDLVARLGLPPYRDLTQRLTNRERDVLVLVADSLSNQEIGERLYITERTVKKHVGNILRKLEMPNRTAIARYARERDWIEG